MGTIIGWLVGKSIFGRVIGPTAARAIAYAALALLLLATLGGIKLAYDHKLISAHDAKQEAVTAKADRQADDHAAVQRRTDDARTTQESTQIKEVVDEARKTGADPRAAYYECVRRQQAARHAGQPSPGC